MARRADTAPEYHWRHDAAAVTAAVAGLEAITRLGIATAGWWRRASRAGRGGARRPLEPQAVVEKFRDNAARALDAAAVRGIEAAALGLHALHDVGALMRRCRA